MSESHPSASTLKLRKGNAKPLYGGHPWVFAEAVAGFDGDVPKAGDEVRVIDERATFLGRGFYSPGSAIAVRILTRADAPIDATLLEARIDEALRLRQDVLKLGTFSTTNIPAEPADPKLQMKIQQIDTEIAKIQTFAAQYGMNAAEETAELRRKKQALEKDLPAPQALQPETTAYRLINSEGDGLGGLIVDVYGEYLSVQFGTAGMHRRAGIILDALEKRLKPKAILDRSDTRTRQIEKLPPPQTTALRGTTPDAPHAVYEHGIQMSCDLRPEHGQKTGLFLDQRENRRCFGSFAAGRNALDVFSYSGAFSLHAARGGARSVTLVESSADALELARANLATNKVAQSELIHAEWPEGFKRLREAGRLFELIVLDPPKYARGRGDASAAISGYRDLNGQAVRLLAPGGILFTCSCSGNVSEVEFERAVAAGLRASGRRAVLLERRGPGPDHPVPPGFDQGRYLKCLILQVV